MIRILHTEWSTGWGGQEIRILEEATRLAQDGKCYSVLATPPGSRLYSAAREAGIPVHGLPFLNRMDLLTLGGLIRIARQHQVQIIHTHSSVDAYLGGMAARLLGVPVVRSRHITLSARKKLHGWLVYRGLADRVLCSSEQIRSTLLRLGCEAETLEVIRAGACPAHYNPEVEPASLASELGLPDQTRFIGMVCMLRRVKGHDILLRALPSLLQKWPSLHVVMAGDGPQRALLENRTRQGILKERVHWLGYRNDVPAVLRALELVIAPSREEACSQSVIQALHCERTLVVSDAGGMTELIRDGFNGRVVRAGDAAALTQAIDDLLGHPETAKDLARTGRLTALDALRADQRMALTLKTYQSLLQ